MVEYNLENQLVISRSTTRDVNDQEGSLPRWDQNYLQLEKGDFYGEITSISYPGLQLFSEFNNKVVDKKCSAEADSFCIGIPKKTLGSGYWCGHNILEDTLFFLSPNDELNFKTPSLSHIYVAVLKSSLIETLIDPTGSLKIKLLGSGAIHVEQGFASMFRAYIESAINEVLENPSVYSKNSVENNIAEGIVNMLYLMQNNENYYRLRGKQKVHRYLVDKTKQLIMSNPSEPLTVSEVCKNLRVSRRCLHSAFVNVLGVNPTSYIRSVRLNQVHRELLNSEEGVLVRDIAAKWGFWHLGMFSKYYKEMFHELPSSSLGKGSEKQIRFDSYLLSR
ncbi:MAG: helix-turn-helix domain-containing protein [Neptuniibacter sp.]